MSYEAEFDKILKYNLTLRHMTIKELYNRANTGGVSYDTYRGRLKDPKTLTIFEINKLCHVLRIPDDERLILKGEKRYEEEERILNG